MRILILGGTRFIGPPAVRLLIEQGHDVTVFHRGKSDTPLPSGVRHLHGDRKALADFAPTFRDFAPEVVLDMVPLTEKDGQTLHSVFGGVARRMVVISSCDVYRAYDRLRGVSPGPPDASPMTEDAPLREKLFPYRESAKDENDFGYSYDKILMERAAQSHSEHLPATVLRLPMVYGPYDYQRRLLSYLKRMDDQRPTILLSETQANWRGPRGYVEDMGAAIARCVTDHRAAGRIYHVADRDAMTERDWVLRIGQAAGWNGEVIALPAEKLPPHLRSEADYTQDWVLDSARIRAELDYAEITPPDDAMHRTVAYQRETWPETFDPAAFDYAAEDAALLSWRKETPIGNGDRASVV